MSRYQQMSEAELKELANERNKRTGCFKQTALNAQRELYKRFHYPERHVSLDDGYIDRRREEFDYNG